MDWLLPAYDWIKALHVIFVIFWMAGLFMLPRFFAYHSEAAPGSPEDGQWVDRERRLLRIILTPSLVLAWVFGLLMIAAMPGLLSGQGWLHAKLTLVLLLSGYHGYLAAAARRLARGDADQRNSRRWRLLNEVPGVVIILAVILVIVKPF